MTTFKSVDSIYNEMLESISNNGATISAVATSNPIHGFCVGIKEHELVFSMREFAETALPLKQWIKEKRNYAGEVGYAFGYWFNRDSFTFNFDVVRIFPEREPALRFAQQNQQTIIYDLDTHTEIKVN